MRQIMAEMNGWVPHSLNISLIVLGLMKKVPLLLVRTVPRPISHAQKLSSVEICIFAKLGETPDTLRLEKDDLFVFKNSFIARLQLDLGEAIIKT